MPLFILWLGIFEESKVALIAVGVFFPVYLGVMGAILSVDRKIVEVGRVFRLSGPALVRRILLPAVLPAYVVSLRSGLGLGWMFVVAAEFMGASEGLGYLLIDGQQLGKPAQIVAAIIAFAVLGKATDTLLALGTAPFLRWQDSRCGGAVECSPSTASEKPIRAASVRSTRVTLSRRAGRDRRRGRRLRLRQVDAAAPHLRARSRDARRRQSRRRCASTAPHEKIGIVFQEPRLLPWLTVADNVGFGLADLPQGGARASASRRRWRASASTTRRTSGRANSPAARRSASPSRARWCRDREVLLLDEPFSALDAFTRADLQDHLLGLWAELKPTLVIVTHDVEEAVVLADRIVVMRPHPGRLFEEIAADLPRPRERQSAAFEFVKRRVLAALDRSLERSAITDDRETAAPAGGWW